MKNTAEIISLLFFLGALLPPLGAVHDPIRFKIDN